MRKLFALGVVVAVLQGCGYTPHKDTAYDPCVACGDSLLDQIPNNSVTFNLDGTVRGTCYPQLTCD